MHLDIHHVKIYRNKYSTKFYKMIYKLEFQKINICMNISVSVYTVYSIYFLAT